MRTYIFGAGASKHAGYPLAKSMGSALFGWMEKRGATQAFDFPATVKFLREEYGPSDDIETLLTRMDERIATTKNLRPRPSDVVLICNCHKPSLIAAIRMWFAEIRRCCAPDYRRFASQVAVRGDCLITFNYDVALESELQRAGKWWSGDGYGFDFGWRGATSEITLLKLHGSVNWRFPVFWNGRPWIDASEIALLGFPGQTDPLYDHSIADSAGMMILPAACKQFFVETNLSRLHEQFWDDLWSLGARALSASEEVVLIGYSLPEVDARACDLLIRGDYSAPIEVCCGGDTSGIVEGLLKSGKDACAAPELRFGEWIDRRLTP